MPYLDLLTQGVKGTQPRLKENLGLITIEVDKPNNTISADAFDGRGDTYNRRSENSEITLVFEGKQIFKGSYSQLAERLLKSK